jgi:hypothetical protein
MVALSIELWVGGLAVTVVLHLQDPSHPLSSIVLSHQSAPVDSYPGIFTPVLHHLVVGTWCLYVILTAAIPLVKSDASSGCVVVDESAQSANRESVTYRDLRTIDGVCTSPLQLVGKVAIRQPSCISVGYPSADSVSHPSGVTPHPHRGPTRMLVAVSVLLLGAECSGPGSHSHVHAASPGARGAGVRSCSPAAQELGCDGSHCCDEPDSTGSVRAASSESQSEGGSSLPQQHCYSANRVGVQESSVGILPLWMCVGSSLHDYFSVCYSGCSDSAGVEHPSEHPLESCSPEAIQLSSGVA